MQQTTMPYGLLSAVNAAAQAIPQQEIQPNLFPVEVFPADIQKLGLSAKNNLGFPVEYTFSSILSAAALAIENKYKIYVKSTWAESPILFIAIVGRAGEFKTHSINLAYRPIREHNRRMRQKYDAALKEWKVLHRDWEKKNDRKEEDEPAKPTYKTLTVSDHTIEGLTGVLKDSRAIGVVMDELRGWFGNFGRYNNGSDVEFWLSAFTGADVHVIRASKEPVYIASPYLSVIGGIQIALLSELGKDGRENNGMTHRILFAWPDEIPQNEWRETDIAPELLRTYTAIIDRLLELPRYIDAAGVEQAQMIHMSTEAKAIWKEWFNENAKMKHESQDDTIAGIARS